MIQLRHRNNSFVITAWLAMILIAGLLSGCVTESTDRRATPVSSDKAREDHIQLGLSYIGEGNRDSARYHLLKAIELDSRSPGAHNGMALLYQMELENELAEQHYKKALALDKSFTRARNNFGVFLFQQERFEEAFDQFYKASEDTDYDLRPQAFLSLGITAKKLGRHEQAMEAWTRALALQPRLSPAYIELAEYYFEQKDYPKARQLLAGFDNLSRPTSRSLWLSIRLENIFGNRDARASKGLALKKLFPYSKENLEYQEWLKNERKY